MKTIITLLFILFLNRCIAQSNLPTLDELNATTVNAPQGLKLGAPATDPVLLAKLNADSTILNDTIDRLICNYYFYKSEDYLFDSTESDYYHAIQNLDSSIKHYQKYKNANPIKKNLYSNGAMSYLLRGYTEMLDGQPSKGLSDIKIGYTFPLVSLDLFMLDYDSKAKADSGDKIGAIKMIKAYIYLDSLDIKSTHKIYEPYCTLARLLVAKKDYLHALKYLNKSISIEPGYADGYYYRALTKFVMDDRNGACSDFSKAGELGKSEAYDFIKQYCN